MGSVSFCCAQSSHFERLLLILCCLRSISVTRWDALPAVTAGPALTAELQNIAKQVLL